jgi:protein-tyrosine phosphatase
MSFTHPARRLAGSVAAAALLLTMAPALVSPADAARPKHPHVASKAIPFTAATVTDAADGKVGKVGKVTVSWTVAKGVTVKVYEGTLARQAKLVGKHRGSGSVTAKVPAASRAYFKLVPSKGAALVVASRDLGLATDPNLRDAGGYRTTNGQWVKTGVLYRGEQMQLSDADAAYIRKLGLSSVYDLRTDSEIDGSAFTAPAPDTAIPGVTDIQLNVLGADADISSYVASLASADAAAATMLQNQLDFVDLPSAKAAYHQLFTDIADDSGASLYHCTAGKDRTGWASAALLTLLGVPAATVMDDYLLSNTYYYESPGVQSTLADIAAGTSRVPASYAAGYDVLMQVRAEWLQAGLDRVTAEYGSMANYFTEGLGIDAATIARLEAKLLVGRPAR